MPESTVSSFILRIVQEQPVPGDLSPPRWHGLIRHVQTDQELRFVDVDQALQFIARFVDLEGGSPLPPVETP